MQAVPTVTRDEFDYWFDRQEEVQAAEDDAFFRQREADRALALAATRCDDCGYLLGSVGHRFACSHAVAS